MSTIFAEHSFIRIPKAVGDHASFRHWVDSEEFPEKCRICYLNGEVWVDLCREQLFSHNQVKAECSVALDTLIRAGCLGRYYPEGVLLTHAAVGFTARPDGIFTSYESVETKKVQHVAGNKGGFVELEGAPDMVLEVVSDSSVEKDTVTLCELYWQAGIKEYWLVDAREEKLEFDILRHTAKGYVATRKQEGWLKSVVFGKSFRLIRQADPAYTLAVR